MLPAEKSRGRGTRQEIMQKKKWTISDDFGLGRFVIQKTKLSKNGIPLSKPSHPRLGAQQKFPRARNTHEELNIFTRKMTSKATIRSRNPDHHFPALALQRTMEAHLVFFLRLSRSTGA